MVFLSINQMPRNASVSSKTTWFRRIQFLEMYHIINSCTNMSKIYANKDAKSCTTWSFPWYHEEEIHWETCRMFDRFADTATRLDFTKIVPRKFHLWFRSCRFLINLLVWMAPFLKENQQLLDTDARCKGSQMAEQMARKHSTPQAAQALFMNHTRNTIWHRIIRVCMGFSTRYSWRQLKVKMFNKNGLPYSICVFFAPGVVILPI